MSASLSSRTWGHDELMTTVLTKCPELPTTLTIISRAWQSAVPMARLTHRRGHGDRRLPHDGRGVVRHTSPMESPRTWNSARPCVGSTTRADVLPQAVFTPRRAQARGDSGPSASGGGHAWHASPPALSRVEAAAIHCGSFSPPAGGPPRVRRGSRRRDRGRWSRRRRRRIPWSARRPRSRPRRGPG